MYHFVACILYCGMYAILWHIYYIVAYLPYCGIYTILWHIYYIVVYIPRYVVCGRGKKGYNATPRSTKGGGGYHPAKYQGQEGHTHETAHACEAQSMLHIARSPVRFQVRSEYVSEYVSKYDLNTSQHAFSRGRPMRSTSLTVPRVRPASPDPGSHG